MDDPNAFFGAGMGLAKVVGELKVGSFFGFGFAGDTQEVGGFLDDEEGGVFEEYFNTGGQSGLGDGEAIGADGHDIAWGERMIELGDGATVDGDGLEFEPSSDLFLLFVGPSGEHLLQKEAGLGNGDRLRHGGRMKEKRSDGNVSRLVRRGERGRV